ncbi:hypothetical protein L950_0231570 [Sphingobacterium sp. IITKGP-BTPF85]|nr:hypothetical protein L950_0231570 [Sphingobacterium sp. IITKGP-BTPF85]
MTVENRKSFLEIKVIWKDDEMFELRVTASNINFLEQQMYMINQNA